MNVGSVSGARKLPYIRYENLEPASQTYWCCQRIFKQLGEFFCRKVRPIPPPHTMLKELGDAIGEERIQKGYRVLKTLDSSIDISNVQLQNRFVMPLLSAREDEILRSVVGRYQLTDCFMIHDYFANDLYRTMKELGREGELKDFQIAFYRFLVLLAQGQIVINAVDWWGPNQGSKELFGCLPSEHLAQLFESLVSLDYRKTVAEEVFLLEKINLWGKILGSGSSNLFFYCRDLDGIHHSDRRVEDAADLVAYAQFLNRCKKLYEESDSEVLKGEVAPVHKKGGEDLNSSFFGSIRDNPNFSAPRFSGSPDPQIVYGELMKWIEAFPSKRVKHKDELRSRSHQLVRIAIQPALHFLKDLDLERKKGCAIALHRIGMHLAPFDFGCRLKKALEMRCLGLDMKTLVKRFRTHIDLILDEKLNLKNGMKKMGEEALRIELKYLRLLDPSFKRHFKEGDAFFNNFHVETRFLVQFSSDMNGLDLKQLEEEIIQFHSDSRFKIGEIKETSQRKVLIDCCRQYFSRLIVLYQLIRDLQVLKDGRLNRSDLIPPSLLDCFEFDGEPLERMGSQITETEERVATPRKRESPNVRVVIPPIVSSPLILQQQLRRLPEPVALDDFPGKNASHLDILHYILNQKDRGYYVGRITGHAIVKNCLDPKCMISVPIHSRQKIAAGTLHNIRESLRESLARIKQDHG